MALLLPLISGFRNQTKRDSHPPYLDPRRCPLLSVEQDVLALEPQLLHSRSLVVFLPAFLLPFAGEIRLEHAAFRGAVAVEPHDRRLPLLQ